MKWIVLVCSCVLATATASANPIPGEQLTIDFDPPNEVYSVYPELYEQVEAYVVLDLNYGYIQEFTSITFALDVTSGMGSGYTFEILIPYIHLYGDLYWGLTIVTDCLPASPPVPIGRLSFIYEGIPGHVRINESPDPERLLVGCQGQEYYYCIRYHGGVGVPRANGDCYISPVEDASWGAIKAIYR